MRCHDRNTHTRILSLLGSLIFLCILYLLHYDHRDPPLSSSSSSSSSLSRSLEVVEGDPNNAGDPNNVMTREDFEEFIKIDFQVAKSQSFNLFDTIRSEDWERMKDYTQRQRKHFHDSNPYPGLNMYASRQWFMNNQYTDFICPHERNIGYGNTGGYWVCDPHRISSQVKERKERGKNGCLIYSVGTQGDFLFEKAIQEAIADEDCEIHVFDTVDYNEVTPERVNFHPWGIRSSKEMPEEKTKTLRETVTMLGHEGMAMDILKLDCDGCEWRIYEDILDGTVNLRQLLVDTHYAPKEAIPFFEAIHEAGFVTFHKFKNSIDGECCAQFSFLKLSKKYFK